MGNSFVWTERLEWLVAILASLASWLWTGQLAAGLMMFGCSTILVLFDRMTGFTREEG
jgi:hypothetical protein